MRNMRSRTTRPWLVAIGVALMSLAWTSASRADLSQTVTFTTLPGNLLQVVLTSTGDAAASNIQILNGVFFNVAGNPVLSAQSANLTSGSNLINSTTGAVVAGNAADGWGLFQGATVLAATTGIYSPPTSYGIISAGFGVGGQSNFGNSNGQNLDGGDYGIVHGVTANNSINPQFSPLVSNSMTFVLDNYTGQAITDVVFQYGTALSTPVPEPSTLAIAGLGALGFVTYGLRRRLKK
jgi:hypothetical protein